MGIDPASLALIGTAISVGTGAMGIANGFVQAGQANRMAVAQAQAAQTNFALKANSVQQLENEQAQAATAQQSTRMAQANRQLATLKAVMSERGLSSASFTGMAQDITNSESLDTGRIGQNYQNQALSDTTQVEAAGQDYVNTVTASRNKQTVADTGAWLNAGGTLLKIGGQYEHDQLELQGTQNVYNAFLQRINKGAPISPFAGSGF